MSYIYKQSMLVLVCIFAFLPNYVFADNISRAPANIQASIFFKILAFNKNISNGGDVTIYVLGAPDFTKAMKSAVGRKIGKSKLVNVLSISKLPKDKPKGLAVIYIGKAKYLDDSIRFCHTHKILSITGNPDLSAKGITLVVGVMNKKAKILLNLTSTKKEGIDWKPDVLRIVQKVK